MDAGRLRHRVDIQQPGTVTQSATTGEITAPWSTVWSDTAAEIAPLSGREFIAAQKEGSQITARITVRWRAGLTARMRVLHGAAIYSIEGVLPDPVSGREYLTLLCSEGLRDG